MQPWQSSRESKSQPSTGGIASSSAGGGWGTSRSVRCPAWSWIATRPALLEDARGFLAAAKWYSDRGIPHRRGYLFHGPPGCGKTSLIQAMTGELGLGVSVISLSSSGMSDDSLHTAMANCEQRNLVVLEDIDAAFTADRSKADGNCSDSLSFSGLLNAIDGIGAQEKRILIMTTNHIERLDPALIRPGRIDYRLLLDRATRSQIARLFLRFFPDSPSADADRFASVFRERAVSPASVQGLLLLHKDDAAAALAAVPAFAESSGASTFDSAAVVLPADAAASDGDSVSAAAPAHLAAAASAVDATDLSTPMSSSLCGSGCSSNSSPSREADAPCADSPLSNKGGDCVAGDGGAVKWWIPVEEASEGGSEEKGEGSVEQGKGGWRKLGGEVSRRVLFHLGAARFGVRDLVWGRSRGRRLKGE
ncbi:hypothetical protein CLOP_g6425 [Closterium sp. NIES-67]|nr:hypothetical protein CLOP_g6425 [Closterium sp. NIES-67]